MTSEPEKLLPCPFCNGEARWVEDTGALDTPFGLVTDHTPTCFLSGRMMAEWSDIIAAWNTRLSSPVSGADMVDREALTEDEALDAAAGSVGSSAVYGRAEAWAEGKTLTILFKDTGQLAKFRYVGLRSAPSAADLRGEPA